MGSATVRKSSFSHEYNGVPGSEGLPKSVQLGATQCGTQKRYSFAQNHWFYKRPVPRIIPSKSDSLEDLAWAGAS